MQIFVDALGEKCPLPVVKTKDAIKQLKNNGGTVVTAVDDEIAVQNLTKMANQKGYGVKSEKIDNKVYHVTMSIKGEGEDTDRPTEDVKFVPNTSAKNTIVVVSSDVMGSGDKVLGEILLKSFIFSLSQQDDLPKTILFYNGGAKLTCENSPLIEDLHTLSEQGVEILTCGTCLKHYGLTDNLKIGTVTNMYDIVERQLKADCIIKP